MIIQYNIYQKVDLLKYYLILIFESNLLILKVPINLNLSFFFKISLTFGSDFGIYSNW